MTLSKRLIISGMMLVAVILGGTALTITVLVNRQFNRYVTSGYLRGMEAIYGEMSDALKADNTQEISAIGTRAVASGYYVEVVSENGESLYASQNIRDMPMMGRNMGLLQMKEMPMFRGMEVKSWVIESENKAYLLNIGYNIGDGLSDDARRFMISVYGGVFTALILGLVLAYIGSRYLATPITDEIKALKDGAREVQTGNLSHRLKQESPIAEIGELKESMNIMAATLLEQEELRRELVATINHEVKTPLTVLKSQIDAFTDGIHLPTEERLTKCRDEIVRLELLMARMEDYDSFSERGYVLNLSEFSIREELEALTNILKPQFDKKGLTLIYSVDSEIKVQTDRYKFRQVMYNLLSNAYKFSDDETNIGITVGSQERNLIVDISNKGIIVKEEEREVIFDPRYRSVDANSKDPYGKGLGLHISKKLAVLMKGQLMMIRSNRDETVFRFSLNDVVVVEDKDKR